MLYPVSNATYSEIFSKNRFDVFSNLLTYIPTPRKADIPNRDGNAEYPHNFTICFYLSCILQQNQL